MKNDYSEYEMTKAEEYYARRCGNQNVTMDYFRNFVRFLPEQKQIVITVDHTKEEVILREDIQAFEELEKEKWGVHVEVLTPEEDAEREDQRIQELRENEESLADFSSRYEIDRELFLDRLEWGLKDDEKETPLNNVLSGAHICLRYGEGILDFVYADFLPPVRRKIMFLQVLKKELAEEYERRFEAAPAGSDRIPEGANMVYNQAQERVEQYFRYLSTLLYTKDVMSLSLYTAICPPVFKSDGVADKALIRYYDYLSTLQQEYLELLEFCFDEEYFPEVIGHLHPAERYHLYRRLHGVPATSERTERMFFDVRSMSGKEMPYGMKVEALKDRLGYSAKSSEALEVFAAKYGVAQADFVSALRIPVFMNIGYEFFSVADILELEFSKLLESDIRFRKCKRCGKYFIRKGNYDTRYCDRMVPGTRRTCQEHAAQENYQKNNADNAAISLYQKYYKRYAARVRSRQLNGDEFKRWKYQAMTKRNECMDGVITVEELTAWMEASFPNRVKKK